MGYFYRTLTLEYVDAGLIHSSNQMVLPQGFQYFPFLILRKDCFFYKLPLFISRLVEYC